MEYLAKVRDASEKKVGLGYRADTVVGAKTDSSVTVPLRSSLCSQDADDFVSENHELLDATRQVYRATDARGSS